MSKEEERQLDSINNYDVSYSGGHEGNEATFDLVDQIQVAFLLKIRPKCVRILSFVCS